MLMMKVDQSLPEATVHSEPSSARSIEPTLVRVEDVRPEGYDGTCLRPLGLCELGGCCDTCWYRPDHPRFQIQGEKR